MVTPSGSDSTTVLGVLSNVGEEPANGLLVVIMLLAFDDNFLSSVNELVAALFWEVLFSEEMMGTIVVLLGSILVLLWNTVGKVLLRRRE